MGIARDISERKRMEEELRQLATTDSLTGLINRRRFMDCLAEQFALQHRQVIREVAVLMVDIDLFKQINDTYGHAAGDALLRHIALLMQENLRQIDVVGRIGGEEFAYLLPGADPSGASDFAERLRRRIETSSLLFEGSTIAVTVSIGIGMLHEADVSPEQVLARADQALYRAKNTGRNRVEIYSE